MGPQLDEIKARKMDLFSKMRAVGYDVRYSSRADVLFTDLDDVFTENKQSLYLAMFKELDDMRYEWACRIWERDESTSDKIDRITRFLHGENMANIVRAGKNAVDKTPLNPQMEPVLRDLKPTKLVIFSYTPVQIAQYFVNKRIDPIYNNLGERLEIDLHATILDYFNRYS